MNRQVVLIGLLLLSSKLCAQVFDGEYARKFRIKKVEAYRDKEIKFFKKFDKEGNLTKEATPKSHNIARYSYKYKDSLLVKKKQYFTKLSKGKSWFFSYDSAKQLTAVYSKKGKELKKELFYDSLGRIVKEKYFNDKSALIKQHELKHDTILRTTVTVIKNYSFPPFKVFTQYFDLQHRMTRSTLNSQMGKVYQDKRYEYNASGFCIKETSLAGNTAGEEYQYAYQNERLIAERKLEEGKLINETRYFYDKKGLLLKTTSINHRKNSKETTLFKYSLYR